MDESEIIITHLVNPHHFYFRWAKDDGFDEDIDKMEQKIQAIMNGKSTSDVAANVSDAAIKCFDVVGVFAPCWHKYIRASVKSIQPNDQYSVWAIDYGLPMLVNAANVSKLPLIFRGLNLKNRRIHLGGIGDCVPAELRYNVSSASSAHTKISKWSANAIEMTQNVVNSATKLQLKRVNTVSIKQRNHHLGTLLRQQPDSTMIPVTKCLFDMNMAVLTGSEEVKKYLESSHEMVCLSTKGEVLDTKSIVKPVTALVAQIDEDALEVESNHSQIDLPLEENSYFDASVSTFGNDQTNSGRSQKNILDAIKSKSVSERSKPSKNIPGKSITNNKANANVMQAKNRQNANANRQHGEPRQKNDLFQHQPAYNGSQYIQNRRPFGVQGMHGPPHQFPNRGASFANQNRNHFNNGPPNQLPYQPVNYHNRNGSNAHQNHERTEFEQYFGQPIFKAPEHMYGRRDPMQGPAFRSNGFQPKPGNQMVRPFQNGQNGRRAENRNRNQQNQFKKRDQIKNTKDTFELKLANDDQVKPNEIEVKKDEEIEAKDTQFEAKTEPKSNE